MFFGKAAVWVLVGGSALAVGLTVGLVGSPFERLGQGAASSGLPRHADVVALAMERAAPDERDALADGAVTLEELNSSRRDVAACARQLGLDVDMHDGEGLKPSNYSVSAATEDQLQQSISVLEGCESNHSTQVEMVWAYQQAARIGVELTDMLPLLNACLESSLGESQFLPLDTVGALDVFLAVDEVRVQDKEWVFARQAYGLCRIQVEEATGLRLP